MRNDVNKMSHWSHKKLRISKKKLRCIEQLSCAYCFLRLRIVLASSLALFNPLAHQVGQAFREQIKFIGLARLSIKRSPHRIEVK